MPHSAPYRVFVDADVLFSRTLRDWLGLLATAEVTPFRVYWTEDVLAETIARLRDRHPDWPGSTTTKIRDLIANAFADGRVEDFVVTEVDQARDDGDRHVAAAARACSAHFLLTSNVRDFRSLPDSISYEVVSPDELFVLIDDSAAPLVQEVVRQQIAYWCRRCEEAELQHYLRAAGCPNFADRVTAHLSRIGGLPQPRR